MKADIFIPTSNRIESLRLCLDSLNNQTTKDFTVILVGLCRDDKVKKLLGKYQKLKIKYLIQKRKGLIGAANEALKIARNGVFVRIDDDVILTRHWYKHLIETYQMDDGIGGVTGPTIMSQIGLKSRDLTAFIETFKVSNNPILRLLFYIYNNIIYENKMLAVSQFLESGVFTLGSNYPQCLALSGSQTVHNLEACNWSSRTVLLRKIGGFDTIYLKGLGDYHEADAALKIKKLGYKLIFNPKVALKHNVEIGTVAKARPAPFYRIQNFLIFYFRFFKITRINQLLRFMLNLLMQNLYYLFRFLSTGKFNQLGAVPGTFVGLIRVITGYKVK